MENLTHTLAGAVLGEAGLKDKTPLATPALLISANLPDIDVFGGLFGLHYLDFHRGVTHALISIPVLALGLTMLLWGIDRLRRSRGRQVVFLPLFAVCLIGLLSHPALDFLNDYGIRPWLPFSDARYYGDMISIVDPWLWIILGAALYLTTSSVMRRTAWGVLASVLLIFVSWVGSAGLGVAWLAILTLTVAAGRILQKRGGVPARAALLVILLYLAGVASIREAVVHAARSAVPGLISGTIKAVDVLPGRSGGPHRWKVVVETEQEYHVAETGLQSWKNHPPMFLSFEKNLEDTRFRESLSQRDMAAMSRFARFPSVDVESSDSGCAVFLRDLRYSLNSRRGWGVARVDLSTRECAAPSSP